MFCFACSFPLGGVGSSHGFGVPRGVQGADLCHFGLPGKALSCAVRADSVSRIVVAGWRAHCALWTRTSEDVSWWIRGFARVAVLFPSSTPPASISAVSAPSRSMTTRLTLAPSQVLDSFSDSEGAKIQGVLRAANRVSVVSRSVGSCPSTIMPVSWMSCCVRD